MLLAKSFSPYVTVIAELFVLAVTNSSHWKPSLGGKLTPEQMECISLGFDMCSLSLLIKAQSISLVLFY